MADSSRIQIQILIFTMHKFMQTFNLKHKSKQVYFNGTISD